MRNKVNFTFFGPVDGLEFHTVPESVFPADFTPPAISSNFEFVQGGRALMVARIHDIKNANPKTWIGSYAQVFEGGLERLGHSFGVGAWFEQALPTDCKLIVSALKILHDSLALHCSGNGRFSDRAQFHKFIFNEFAPKFNNFCEQKFPNWSDVRSDLGISSLSNTTAFLPVTNLDDELSMGRALSWSLWSLGANEFGKIILASDASGVLSDRLIYLDDLDHRSAIRFLEVGRENKKFTMSLMEFN